MKSYTIRRTGFTTIKAEDEEMVIEITQNLPYNNFEW